MVFLILLCTILVQLTLGQTSTLNGQGAINTQKPNLSNARSLATTAPARNLGSIPTTNQLASQLATGNGLVNKNFANGNAFSFNGNTPRLNPSSNLPNGNIASQHFASNLASTSLDNNAKLNLAKSVNSNSGIANQVRPSANPTLPGNIASLTSKYSSPYTQNYGNFYGNGNIASGNIANANLARYPNAGGYYSQALVNGPGSQQYGIRIQADALEMAGSVAVTGHLPIFGTASLNGRLPTGGSGTINYACSG